MTNLGLKEAAEYLRNARERYESGEPTGFADCKTNCRNALFSVVKNMTGKENIKEGLHLLAEDGMIGEREEELIEAFENFLVKFKGFLSKKGPHPPLAAREDAELSLKITVLLSCEGLHRKN